VSDFFVEFEIVSEDGFGRLSAVFNALRHAKQSDRWQDDNYWLAFFDEDARSHFWWPSPEELKDWERRWFSTPVPDRFTDESLKTPWDFGSMIEAFRNGDYELVDCERITKKTGRLSFDPDGWPYGGTGCMRALVESFGHRVLAEPDV
jgi:hypothetical protein